MEKPTGVIQKIIESLQQVNALDIYSPIEKDIILHNLRAAYMIFLNIPIEEHSTENRVEMLDFEEEAESRKQKAESRMEKELDDEVIEDASHYAEEEEEPLIEEEPIEEDEEVEEIEEIEEEEEEEEEEEIEEEEEDDDDDDDDESLVEEEPIEIEKPLFSVAPLVANEPVIPEKPLIDDILEFIPDAKPQSGLLFDDMVIPKSETKSLNDFLTEKKEDQSLGTKFQQSFIPDLTKAIAINEKFSFIRELFHNSGVDFSNAIQKLNDCENLEAAFVIMEELKHQYLWDTTSTSYLSLCDLVRRRFL